MNKKFFLSIFLIVIIGFIFVSPVYSEISLDLRSLSYSTIVSLLTNNQLHLSNSSIQEVWISHPFPRNKPDNKLSDRYYRLTREDQHWTRGYSNSVYGSFSEFTNLIELFKEHNRSHRRAGRHSLPTSLIQISAWIDPFSKEKDFNRQIWNTYSFIPESLAYGQHPFLNIQNSNTLRVLKTDFGLLNSLQVNWIIDLQEQSGSLPNLIQFLKNNLNTFSVSGASRTNSLFTISPQSGGIFSLFYFTPYSGSLTQLVKTRLPYSTYPFFTKNLSKTEVSAIFYLLTQGKKVVLPYSVWKKELYRQIFLEANTIQHFRIRTLSSNILVLEGTKKLVLFYTGTKSKWFDFSGATFLEGSFKSDIGNAILFAKGKHRSGLIFPQSVYLWNLETP